MWRTFLVTSLLGLIIVGLSHDALANGNDLRLYRLAACKEGTTPGPLGDHPCVANVDYVNDPNGQAIKDFEALSKSLGRVFAPTVLGPAETLGLAGHSVGVEYKMSMPDSGAQWRALNKYSDETGDITPDPFSLLQFHVRKGLPFSFELEGLMSWMLDSNLIWIGGAFKWTILEDVLIFIPDLAVRGHGGLMLGSPDMNLITAGADILLSKSFGIGGIVNITPYVGASPIWIKTSSRVIDVDPEYSATPVDNYAPEFVFENTTQQYIRGFGGLRFLVSKFSFTAELATDGEVHNIGVHVGAVF